MASTRRTIGPAALVTAAFIGPGTVTVCTLAGVQFGGALLWAVALSTLATMALQEMSARVGLVSGQGLTETIRDGLSSPWLRFPAMALILGAVVVGNAAYEAGNVTGTGLGLAEFLPVPSGLRLNPVSLAVGVLALGLVTWGNFRLLERTLISVVILMSIAFVAAAVIVSVQGGGLSWGALRPGIPPGSLLTVLAVVGTTVVPYNLFLHASLVSRKWSGPADLAAARWDTVIAIAVGGVVSAAIVVCGAAVQGGQVDSAADLAAGLESVFGQTGRILVAIGLAAAGLTSAITAPVAAAFVAAGAFRWPADLGDRRLKMVAAGVVLVGTLVSAFSLRPVELIRFAQAANGLLLPIAAGFLLWIVNRQGVMGSWRNSRLLNVIGGAVVLVTLGLAAKSFAALFSAG